MSDMQRETTDAGKREHVSASARKERIGIMLVHGIGQQRNFEHLEAETRQLVRAIRHTLKDTARVTLQVRTSQDGIYLGEHETWRGDDGAPIIVDIRYLDGSERQQSLEFREVWWADLDEPPSITNAVQFWLWALTLWARPTFMTPPELTDEGTGTGKELEGHHLLMLPPGEDCQKGASRPPRTTAGTRLHLYTTAVVFALILCTLYPVNLVLKRLINFSVPLTRLLLQYLADIKLYQQEKRRDLWPLTDMGRPPRIMIRRRMVRAMVDVALEDYNRWYIMAHSLGTVVACNGMMETAHALPNYLDRDRWDKARRAGLGGRKRATDETTPNVNGMKPARPIWLADDDVIFREMLFKKMRGILTYGSPLDKFAALFPAIVPLNRNAAVYPKNAEWINVFDPLDPVAANLDFFKPPQAANKVGMAGTRAMGPRNFAYSAFPVLLLSHIHYLNFDAREPGRLVNIVTEWLLTGKTFQPPASANDKWLTKAQEKRLNAWRVCQIAVFAYFAAMLLTFVGVVLFSPAHVTELTGASLGFLPKLLSWLPNALVASSAYAPLTLAAAALVVAVLGALYRLFSPRRNVKSAPDSSAPVS